MNKIIILIIPLLLAFSVNLVNGIGEFCLNDVDCTGSEVCQGDECRVADITDLLDALKSADGAPPECTDDDDCTDDDFPYCNVHDDCVECLDDNDCPTDYECDAYECEPEYVVGDGICIPDWICSGWSVCINQKQTQICTDTEDCGTEVDKPSEERFCSISPQPTCYDGMQNQNEQGVDCGGPCSVCATCYDEIENCHDGLCEEDVDCGGPCMPCSLEKASKSPAFWIIFITAFLVIIVLLLGFWYFKLKKGAEEVGEQVKQITKKPPTQPSSLLRI